MFKIQIKFDENAMIKAVFLDFYGTIVRFTPSAEDIQQQAAEDHGLKVNLETIVNAYPVADKYMADENARKLISSRSHLEQIAFFTEYELRLLTAAGHQVSDELAAAIWHQVNITPKSLSLYEDAIPALKSLKEANMVVGIITNMNSDIGPVLERLGIANWIDFWTTSSEVGSGKPHKPIFEAALKKASVNANEALHVGDQYEGDFLGAKSAGLYALYLNRMLTVSPKDSKSISTLEEIASFIGGALFNTS